jgi:hypothetical protein
MFSVALAGVTGTPLRIIYASGPSPISMMFAQRFSI